MARKTLSRARRPKMMVAEALAGRILKGEYPAGGLLPPEADLLAEFDVSRTCMREALQVLGAKGLVVSKPRIGTTVAEPLYWNFLDADVLRWRQQFVSRDVLVPQLFAMRRLIEPEAAALAAANIDEKGLAALQAALLDMARGNGDRTAETIKADVAFHRILLAASGNILMSGFGAVVEEALRIVDLDQFRPGKPRALCARHAYQRLRGGARWRRSGRLPAHDDVAGRDGRSPRACRFRLQPARGPARPAGAHARLRRASDRCSLKAPDRAPTGDARKRRFPVLP